MFLLKNPSFSVSFKSSQGSVDSYSKLKEANLIPLTAGGTNAGRRGLWCCLSYLVFWSAEGTLFSVGPSCWQSLRVPFWGHHFLGVASSSNIFESYRNGVIIMWIFASSWRCVAPHLCSCQFIIDAHTKMNISSCHAIQDQYVTAVT